MYGEFNAGVETKFSTRKWIFDFTFFLHLSA